MNVIMMNKRTGDLYLVSPCWEFLTAIKREYVLDTLYCEGVFIITGWLVTNKHDVTLKAPLGFNCDKTFSEIGQL